MSSATAGPARAATAAHAGQSTRPRGAPNGASSEPRQSAERRRTPSGRAQIRHSTRLRRRYSRFQARTAAAQESVTAEPNTATVLLLGRPGPGGRVAKRAEHQWERSRPRRLAAAIGWCPSRPPLLASTALSTRDLVVCRPNVANQPPAEPVGSICVSGDILARWRRKRNADRPDAEHERKQSSRDPDPVECHPLADHGRDRSRVLHGLRRPCATCHKAAFAGQNQRIVKTRIARRITGGRNKLSR